jgi:hypothetical protein
LGLQRRDRLRLSGLCIASERGWISRAQARERLLATLNYYAEKAVHEHGWFYHFVDSASGARKGTNESLRSTLPCF